MSTFAHLEQPPSSPVRNGTNGVHPPPPKLEPGEILVLKSSKSQAPCDRWETAFIWGFITRFTELKGSVEGLESVTDFEEALLTPEPTKLLQGIVAKFMDNLTVKRQSVDSVKQLNSSLYAMICQYCVGNERSVWWDREKKANMVPFMPDMNFFTLDCLQKVTILRQMVEWQLSHNSEIRSLLDRAYGVVRGGHRKRADDAPRPALVPPDPEHTKEKLEVEPLGQDLSKRRYWVFDDSPRIYISGNPYKHGCKFNAVATSRDEYIAVANALKVPQPTEDKDEKRIARWRSKQDDVVRALLGPQLTKVDVELERVAIARKKMLERKRAQDAKDAKAALLAAETELRATRTRQKLSKVDYVYELGSEDERDRKQGIFYDDGEEVDELDDDAYDDTAEHEAQQAQSEGRSMNSTTTPGDDELSSTDELDDDSVQAGSKRKRKAPSKANGAARRKSGRGTIKQPPDETSLDKQPQRRSARRSAAGGPEGEGSDTRATKRLRRGGSVGSSAAFSSSVAADPTAALSSLSINGVATAGAPKTSALKPGERVIDIAGKKKSKFWFYAVEAGTATPSEPDAVAQEGTSTVVGANTTPPTNMGPIPEHLPDANGTVTGENGQPQAVAQVAEANTQKSATPADLAMEAIDTRPAAAADRNPQPSCVQGAYS
ncbi:hypothetical protein FRB96_006934 [Tulasnella sp. 330]|nr:hypothetical protein FRB96_006934 [Tulasnella sp. 330]KAG8876565.1 hypothetical protein FRB97_004118 [Tulasnella sp. 331]KAG8889844.1 hypothetical protein FRB98_002493 [Tulasnella sp. 332]